MEWKGRRQSTQVTDARGRGGSMPGAGRGGNALGLLSFVMRRFGPKGVLAAILLGGVLWKMGVLDPAMLLSGGPTTAAAPAEISPKEQECFEFVKTVLADTEDVWTKEFKRIGRHYELPSMTVYRGRTNTACGTGSAAMGPFYCPADRRIYIDLSFYDELERTFQAPGDFAQAYVIAHEVGHHVQKLLGATAKVDAMRNTPEANQWSVRLELQADYYAGLWAHHNAKYLEPGDVEEAMRAAFAIGDDAIQKKSQGRVVPHSFTHGTSAQRMRWFKKGLESGKIEDGDTFTMPYNQL